MNTYMKRRYRFIGIIISLAVILSCAFGSFFVNNNLNDVYADGSILTLNASDLKAGKHPEYYDNKTCEFNISSPKLLILNMDDTLHVNKCDIDAALEIKGDRTLFIDESVYVYGAVTINDNVGVAFNKSKSGICVLSDSRDKTYSFTCFGNITASNNNNPIIWGDAEFIMARGSFVADNSKTTLISTNGDVYIEDGSVKINNTNRFAKCRDFYICGGDIKADMNDSFLYSDHFTMTGGKIDAYSHKNETIYTTKGTRISNGYIKAVSSDNSAFYTEGNMNITGGYVEAVSELNDNADDINGYSIIDKTHSPIDSVKEIIIGDGWGIKEPADGKIIYDDVNLYRIVDSKGMWTRKVVIQKYEKKDDPSEEDDKGDSKDDTSKDDSSQGGSDNNDRKPQYSNEWVNGKWYNADGICDYAGTLSWKSNATGWWVEDSLGWYPTSQWQKIDGKWYYFLADGYMDYSEYRDGCWLGADGAWDEAYSGGHWMSDSNGWWYEDASGWYPVSKWLWIDGSCYYFEASGYMARNKYVDGCWLGADGAWVK